MKLLLSSYQLPAGVLLVWKSGRVDMKQALLKEVDIPWINKSWKNVCVPLTLCDTCLCVCSATDGCNIWSVWTGCLRCRSDCQACQDEWGICLGEGPVLVSVLLSAALIHLHLLCTSDSKEDSSKEHWEGVMCNAFLCVCGCRVPDFVFCIVSFFQQGQLQYSRGYLLLFACAFELWSPFLFFYCHCCCYFQVLDGWKMDKEFCYS